MANYKSQKEIIAEIASNLEKLESKKLSIGELEAHVDLVRELYERTIVLRYKIFEEKNPLQTKVIENQKTESKKEAVKVEKAEEPKEIEKEEPKVSEPEKKAIIDDNLPTIDFSVFDEPSVEIIEEKVKEIKEEVKPENIVIEEKSEPVVEKIPEPVAEIKEEAVVEKKEEAKPEVKEEKPVSKGSSSKGFDKKFETISSEMKGQLGFSKLDTLVGAFGLNERLQFINELFDGSSEQFSEAIKEFDKLATENDAKASCTKFASQHNWDEESETVDEFIQKICRRYA